MTPLRWNWSANTPGSLKPGRVSDLASPLSAARTYEVALAAPMAASSGPWRRLCRGLWRGVWPNAHAVRHALLLGRWVRQLTDTMVEHHSLAPSPPWQVGMARVDRAARVAKGSEGRQSLWQVPRGVQARPERECIVQQHLVRIYINGG
jgi:hypothetical protein